MVLTHKLTLNAITEPFFPLFRVTLQQLGLCSCTCPTPSLYFCSVLECDILCTRILEYVFLKWSIDLGFTQNKPLTSVSESLVSSLVSTAVSGQKTGETRGKWWFTREVLALHFCSLLCCCVLGIPSCFPLSSFCLLLPLDWQVSVFCIFQYHGIKTQFLK